MSKEPQMTAQPSTFEPSKAPNTSPFKIAKKQSGSSEEDDPNFMVKYCHMFITLLDTQKQVLSFFTQV